MYKVIFCDLDGTLFEDSERHYRCYCDIVSKYGGNCIDKETYWADKRNKINRKELLKKSNFQGSYEDYIQTWNEWIEQEKYLKFETPREKLDEILGLLRKTTEKLVLITMRQKKEALEKQLADRGLLSYFDEIIKGDPTREKKADLVAQQYGESALVIGDTEADGELSQRIGSRFIAVTSGLRERKYLYMADYFVEDLAELKDLLTDGNKFEKVD